MSILIFGHLADVHSVAVRWALRQKGSGADIFGYDFPSGASFSFDLTGLDLKCASADVDLASIRTIWNRRVGRIALPPWLHPNDHKTAEITNRHALDYVRQASFPGQVWVNPVDAQARIGSKINQLMLAREVGFRVPPTLISNDAARIAAFVETVGNVIMKPMAPMLWEGGERRRETSTTPITSADCRDPRRMSACPMIYQGRVEKAYELRAVVFGAEVLCVRIDSQARVDTSLDWRIFEYLKLPIEQIPCPEPLRTQLLDFTARAGLLHGSFDLAVTPNDEIVFFEINEQGQSLWIEEIESDIKVLDRWAQFLMNPTRNFLWRPDDPVSFHDYRETAEARRLRDMLLTRTQAAPAVGVAAAAA